MAKRLHTVEEKFLNTVKQNNLINQRDKIVVGVSGGPDSITLLICLNKYKEKFNCELIVAHINHLIREESTEDEQFVKDVCKTLNLKFYSKQENVLELSKKLKKGTEETGREVRYAFFNEILKKENANKIAIAHNMNDNAETMLLNLIRGAGLKGLEGIQPKQYDIYIRPLINCTRNEIEDYCEKNNLNPRIDQTNSQNIYTRNIVRNNIIPELEQINPNIIQTLSRTSTIIKENNEFTNKQINTEYEKLHSTNKNTIVFDLKQFNKIDVAIKTGLIIKAIEELQGNNHNVDKANIDDILKLSDRNIGNKHIRINKKIIVKLENGKIIFLSQTIA